MIRLAVIDDDSMLIGGLRRWADDIDLLDLVLAAQTVDEYFAELPEHGPVDVVLLDLVLRDRSDPMENVGRLVDAGHAVLVVSAWSPPGIITATFAAGARGYVTKDHDLADLGHAVREVAGGGTMFSPELATAVLRDVRRPALSPRERDVLVAYASGMTLRAAARHVGVSPETAKTYLERVKAKYQQAGRPTFTKLDMARRVREDILDTDATARPSP